MTQRRPLYLDTAVDKPRAVPAGDTITPSLLGSGNQTSGRVLTAQGPGSDPAWLDNAPGGVIWQAAPPSDTSLIWGNTNNGHVYYYDSVDIGGATPRNKWLSFHVFNLRFQVAAGAGAGQIAQYPNGSNMDTTAAGTVGAAGSTEQGYQFAFKTMMVGGEVISVDGTSKTFQVLANAAIEISLASGGNGMGVLLDKGAEVAASEVIVARLLTGSTTNPAFMDLHVRYCEDPV